MATWSAGHRDDQGEPGALPLEARGHARLRSSSFFPFDDLRLEDAASPATETTRSFISCGFRVAGREVWVELEHDAEGVAGVPDLGDLVVLDPVHRHSAVEELPKLWAKTSDAGRHAIAEAVFERIDVLGATDYTFTLTAHAKSRGWDAAFGAGVVRVKDGQSGRGERDRPLRNSRSTSASVQAI